MAVSLVPECYEPFPVAVSLIAPECFEPFSVVSSLIVPERFEPFYNGSEPCSRVL